MAYQRWQVRTAPDHTRRLRPTWLPPIWIAALLLAVALGWGTVQTGSHTATALRTLGIAADGSTYGVADLQRQVARDPGDWMKRTVLVQGRAMMDRTWSAPDSIVTRIGLIDPNAPRGTAGLALAWGNPDPLRASLRHLPVIGRLAPQPQVLHWGVLATYRVQLRAAPVGTCTGQPCYEVLLLDAAP